MLENTQSEDVPVEQQNAVNPRIHRRVPTKAAMIGLAISMGATSLLVTRQSDQALAAEPVGNQNTASTIPAGDAEIKLGPKKINLESESATSSPNQSEKTILLEPTAVSQVPGLSAKWQAVASRISVPANTQVAVPTKPQVVDKVSISSADANTHTAREQLETEQQPSSTDEIASSEDAGISNEVNAQLKAQQEFALYNLQRKSNRLRASLAKLKSEETEELSNTTHETKPIAVVTTTPQNTQQSEISNDVSKANLVSRLKQRNIVNIPITTPAVTPAPATPVVMPTTANYEVKPGDTLAAIAKANNTSVSELVKANHLTDPNQLQINQTLIIPVAEGSSSATKAPIAVNANTSVNSVITDRSIPEAGELPANNQIPAHTSTAATANPQPILNPDSSYGMGGDTPIPTAITEMQLAKKQDAAKVKSSKNSSNPRLRSLQAEIEKLRAKYRAQQSGNTVVAEDTDNTARAIPVSESSHGAIPIPVAKVNAAAVPIPVPQPKRFDDSVQQIQPTFRATRLNNEPVNPEFFANRNTKFSTPSPDADTSQFLGVRRGSKVSPELPPLAAVDTYLPKPIEEITPTSKGYIWPAKGVLTSGYGRRWGRMHKGIDIANSIGTPIYASSAGVVEKAGWNRGGYGNLVDIRHTDGSLTRYAHNSKILVRVGQQVEQGDIIAEMGNTGFSTGPHSHFEIHPSGKGAVNPMAFLPPRV
ncbi:MAG: peptidoglycan DD-metalloendopeptidase family protein [Fischerella sp.]|nr:peptidoglycan DD-metalloendopeptidase family protein [Fischerella sp.]